jgi:flagellar export protein FliJ
MFSFRLATLHRFRKSIEAVEELAFRRLLSEITSVQSKLDELDNRRTELRHQRELALLKAQPAATLHLLSQEELHLNHLRGQLRDQLNGLNERKAAQFDVYRNARQARQVLDEIFHQQNTRYSQEQSRKEQRMLDDLHLLKRHQSE